MNIATLTGFRITGFTLTGRRLIVALVGLALVLALWFLLRPPALEVDAATVARGPMEETVGDLGETRVRDLYTVSAPVTGELQRVPFKAGARLAIGDVVARIQPVQASPVDSRSYDETTARIGALNADLVAAQARVREARAAEELASATHARFSKLVVDGLVSRAEFDAAEAELKRSSAATRAAIASESAARHGLDAAEASLVTGRRGPVPVGQVVAVRTPVSGSVLAVLHESGGPVAAGTALVEIGDPARIEVFSEMLSSDAVRVPPGAPVEIVAWGGDKPLSGKVRLVEPFGFRKISALGVEEQRVKVVIDLAGPSAGWQRLGHGYRVVVRIGLWSGKDVLQVPIGALFRQGADWAAFAIGEDGRAHRVKVKVGHMNDETAEVLGGLEAGQEVIVHPGESVADDVRVRAVARE